MAANGRSNESSRGQVGAVLRATIGVRDLAEAARLFRDTMQFGVDRVGRVAPTLLRAWTFDEDARVEFMDLACRGYPIGRLRLLQLASPAATRVRDDAGDSPPDSTRDVGPKAVDFYVRDPIGVSVAKIEALGYAFRSPPIRHQLGSDSETEECLFNGPDGVPILLMVGHRHSTRSLRPGSPEGPFSELATVSIVAGDIEATREFYGRTLGLQTLLDAETPARYRDEVDDLCSVPHGTRVHFLMYAAAGEPSGKILLMHYFERTGKTLIDRMHPRNLGFSAITHQVRNLREFAAHLRRYRVPILWGPDTVTDDGPAYQMLLARGPNAELFEFIECS